MDNQEVNSGMKNRVEDAYKVRETFYAQYRHELDQLWHNSLFLWGFDSLLFTGYGALILAWLKEDVKTACIANIVASAIAGLGLIVTMVWITLAKGSRLWQEWNESRIKRLESDRRFFHLPREYAMGGTTHRIENIDDSLWSTKIGRYSPGRISIILPQLIWSVWLAILILHRIYPILMAFDLIAGDSFAYNMQTGNTEHDAGFVLSIIIFWLSITGVIALIYWGALKFVKKRALNDYMRNEDYGEEFCFEVMMRIDQAESVLDETSFKSVEELRDYVFDYYRNVEYDLFLALKDSFGYANFDGWAASSNYHRLIKEFMDDYMHGAIKSASETAWINRYSNDIRSNFNEYRELIRSKYGA